jgi:hypothetical protein
MLKNGCFGFKGARSTTNQSTALYSDSFGNFRLEISFMAAVDPVIAHNYDMFFFTDSRAISSLMQLISQGWTVCPVEPSSIDGIFV